MPRAFNMSFLGKQRISARQYLRTLLAIFVPSCILKRTRTQSHSYPSRPPPARRFSPRCGGGEGEGDAQSTPGQTRPICPQPSKLLFLWWRRAGGSSAVAWFCMKCHILWVENKTKQVSFFFLWTLECNKNVCFPPTPQLNWLHLVAWKKIAKMSDWVTQPPWVVIFISGLEHSSKQFILGSPSLPSHLFAYKLCSVP